MISTIRRCTALSSVRHGGFGGDEWVATISWSRNAVISGLAALRRCITETPATLFVTILAAVLVCIVPVPTGAVAIGDRKGAALYVSWPSAKPRS